jgi:2-iminobutanoate/2-iminopropanoate deaminase
LAKIILFTAGQVPYDANRGVKHRGDFKAQARAVFAAIQALVEAGGSTLDNVVKITTYVTDVRYRLDFRSVREEFFGAKGPASTMVEVSSLAHPDYLIEVEAIAVV